MCKTFSGAHFTTFECFPAGIQAIEHLRERGVSTSIQVCGSYSLETAVTLIPFEHADFGRRLIRIVPNSPSAVRKLDQEMHAHARSLTWVAPSAIVVAVNINRLVGKIFTGRCRNSFYEALDQLCGYKRPRSPKNQGREVRPRDLRSSCGYLIEG